MSALGMVCGQGCVWAWECVDRGVWGRGGSEGVDWGCTLPPPRWPLTRSVRILLECILIKQINYPMSVLKCQLRTNQMTLTLHAIYFCRKLQNSALFPKGTVQRRLLETIEISQRSHIFNSNFCLKDRNAHV